jgi:6-phosphogluconolactonase
MGEAGMKIHELPWPDGITLTIDADRDTLAEHLAEQVAGQLRHTLQVKARALLVVSGGSTPVPFFQALSQKTLAWNRVDVTLADERWVSDKHPDSNAALVKRHLQVNQAAALNWVPLLAAEDLAGAEVSAVDARLKHLAWPIDVLVLGMGNDGHTASLFPCAKTLPDAMTRSLHQVCERIEPQTAPHARLTLTLPVLQAARQTFLHVVGQEKLNTLACALSALNRPLDMPIRAFCRAGLQVYWSP